MPRRIEPDIPATVHVTIGADIIHMHPDADGAAIGQATMADFHRLAAVVAELSRGVVINLGSAVVMPEVFLKALNLARNLGRKVTNFTAADMDFVRHYRPRINVVERPTENGGQRIMLTGHHELMFPLLAAAIREELAALDLEASKEALMRVAIASAQNFFAHTLRADRAADRLRLSRSLCRSDERGASRPSRPTHTSSTSRMASRRNR